MAVPTELSNGRIHRGVGGILPSSARPAGRRAARHAGADYGASGVPDWREIDWSMHTGDRVVDGRRLRYLDYGEGDPVVFVHGWTSNWQCWLENIPAAAAAGRRVIALDLPGSGLSEMPIEEISISSYARCVDRLCETLDVGPAVVVGNSMGGFISAELAIQIPERVSRLVLVSAAGISSAQVRQRPVLAFAYGLNLSVGQTWRHSRRSPFLIRPALREVAVGSILRHPSLMSADYLYEIMGGFGKEGFVDQLKACLSYDFKERLPEIACPTLIVWGREDMLVPCADAYEYERLIDDSRVLMLEDTGHLPMAERPLAFNEALGDFTAETGAAELKADAAV